MRPSTDRRQGQPPCCVYGAPGPRAQLFAPQRVKFRVHHPCTRLASKPFTPAPHLYRQSSPSLPHTSPAPALLPLRREGCGVHQALPSSPRRPTTPWPQVTILDFLETFSSSSRRCRHQFLLSVSLLLPDFRRAVCVMGRTGVASRAAVRGVHIFARIVMLVLLKYRSIKRMGLICTLADAEGTPTRPRQLCVCMPWKGTRH